MKRYPIIVVTLILTAIILVFVSVLLTYLAEVILALLNSETESYIFGYNTLSFILGQFFVYFIIAGWAYLLAVILLHICYKTEMLHSKFKYVIILVVLFYISITYPLYGISLPLLGYFIAVIALY